MVSILCFGVCVNQGSPLDNVPGEAQMYFECVQTPLLGFIF